MAGITNLERWQAMHGLRSSSAAQPHRNRARDAHRGVTKGGRKAAIAHTRGEY